jgi:hypothetical protein
VSQQNFKQMLDQYHHLLESFLNVLASASSQILRVLFVDVIYPVLFNQAQNPELKVYILRISEKILAICQGDLKLPPTFFQNMIQMVELRFPKNESSNNLKFYVLKLWETAKLKYLYNLPHQQLEKVISLLHENLIQLAENDSSLNETHQKLYHYIDMIQIVIVRVNQLNLSLHSQEFFDDPHHSKNPSEQLNGQIIENLKLGKIQPSHNITEPNSNSGGGGGSNIILKYFCKVQKQQRLMNFHHLQSQ